MNFCKKAYRNKGKQAVLTRFEAELVMGGTNGNGLDPTDTDNKAKAKVAPIYKTKSSGG
ncbi:hypothetical protein [Pseudoalteromonas phenolica]|uniref:hypothetical protein n=1 Tax=Pseudoalteromonas phenolica TaxID=161398 RepID=UPI001486D690|nr:hypothetical protein [Pseudoalteromonas phenolica]